MDANWRRHDWGVISLWFKGDRTATRASLRVRTGEDKQITQGYSLNLPMDSTRWRCIRAPVGSFWNRQRVAMDTRKIVRIYIGHRGPHHFEVDQIALEAPQRPVPCTKIDGDELGIVPELLQFDDGRYSLRFDPSPPLPGPASATAEFTLPGVTHTAADRFQRATAGGEVSSAAQADARPARGV